MGTKTNMLVGIAMIALAVPAAAQNRGRTAPPATITFGQTIEGEIAAPRAGECPPADPRVRSYNVTVEADTRLEVTMRADDFDTLVEIGKMDGCTYTMLGSNDDGSGEDDGLNSRLIATLRDAGTYVIRAKALADDGAGKFSLALNRLAAPPPPPTPIPLTLGASAQGALTTNDAMIDTSSAYGDEYASEYGGDMGIDISESGRPYHLYSLTGSAGQDYLIKMDSEEFDAFLEAGSMSPLGYSVSASNDDGGGEEDGLNSRLRVKFQTDGTIIIRASPLGNDTGAYTISADVAPPVEATDAAPAVMEAPHEH